MLIFKICHNVEWQAAQASGLFHGTAKDKEDGFLHFSTGPQVPGTLARFYADADNLMLLAIDADRLGRKLKWELASDGDRFPHLYAALSLADVKWSCPIPRNSNDAFVLPVQVFVKDEDPQGRA